MENTTRKTVTINLNIKEFMPTILWVLKARSTDKNRYQLNYLNIDDMGYCCTDGKRLHLCKDKSNLPAGLENGLYNVIVAKDLIIFNPEEGTFPDYKAVIPTGLEKKLDINLCDNKDSASLSIALVKIFRVFSTALNIDYLKDLSGYIWSIAKDDKQGSPTLFTSGDLLAIIMPLRIND